MRADLVDDVLFNSQLSLVLFVLLHLSLHIGLEFTVIDLLSCYLTHRRFGLVEYIGSRTNKVTQHEKKHCTADHDHQEYGLVPYFGHYCHYTLLFHYKIRVANIRFMAHLIKGAYSAMVSNFCPLDTDSSIANFNLDTIVLKVHVLELYINPDHDQAIVSVMRHRIQQTL